MNNYSYEKRGAVMENNERKIENCNGNIIHEDIVVRVKDKLPAEETLYDLAELFKVFYTKLLFLTIE